MYDLSEWPGELKKNSMTFKSKFQWRNGPWRAKMNYPMEERYKESEFLGAALLRADKVLPRWGFVSVCGRGAWRNHPFMQRWCKLLSVGLVVVSEHIENRQGVQIGFMRLPGVPFQKKIGLGGRSLGMAVI